MNPDQSIQPQVQAQRSILIAEDEPFLLKSLAEIFEQAGFLVYRAPNGQVALELAMANHPQVCVLDIMMPVMDGLTVLQRLRQDITWGKNAIIIMLTNVTADSRILESMQKNPPSYYFVKESMNPDQLLAKVLELYTKDSTNE